VQIVEKSFLVAQVSDSEQGSSVTMAQKPIFNIQTKCLHLVGLHRADLIKSPSKFIAFYVAMVMCMISCSCFEAYYIVKNHDDILGSSEAFSPLSTIVISMTKLFTFIFYREEFYELMDRIKNLSEGASAKSLLQIEKANRIDQTMAFLYLASSWVVGVVQNSVPAVTDFVRFLQGQATVREMPWKSAYPYDATLTPAYELSYLNLVCVTYFAIFTFVSQNHCKVLEWIKVKIFFLFHRHRLILYFSAHVSTFAHTLTFCANLLTETRRSSSKGTRSFWISSKLSTNCTRQ
jgi:7tm Odorant receptor